MKVRKLTESAVLSAISLVIFVLESQIPPILPIPGIKLGLANVVTLYTKATLGTRCAMVVLFIKICLGNFFAGSWMSFVYSLFGGILCFSAEFLMFKILSEKQMWAISITGAVFHNIGQILAAVLFLGTEKVIWYLTVLIPAGIITGAFTGLCATYTLAASERLNFQR